MRDRELREHLKHYGCPQVLYTMLDMFPVASVLEVLAECVERSDRVPGSANIARDLKRFAEELPEAAWNKP